MIVLGVLILLGVAVVTVAAIVRGGDDVSLDLGSFTVKTDGVGMFLAGAAALLVALVGLWLVRRGLRRSRQRRQEIHELRDRASRNESAARREQATTSPTTTEETSGDQGRHTDADGAFDSSPHDP